MAVAVADHPQHVVTIQELSGEPGHLARTGIEGSGHRSQRVPIGERRGEQREGCDAGCRRIREVVVGQVHRPLPGQHGQNLLALGVGHRRIRDALADTEGPGDIGDRAWPRPPGLVGEGDRGELCRPPVAKHVAVLEVTGLVRAGGEGGDFGRSLGLETGLLEGGFDIDPTLRERPQDGSRDVGQLPQAVAPDRPRHTEGGQLGPQCGLVHGGGRLLPQIQLAGVGC